MGDRCHNILVEALPLLLLRAVRFMVPREAVKCIRGGLIASFCLGLLGRPMVVMLGTRQLLLVQIDILCIPLNTQSIYI